MTTLKHVESLRHYTFIIYPQSIPLDPIGGHADKLLEWKAVAAPFYMTCNMLEGGETRLRGERVKVRGPALTDQHVWGGERAEWQREMKSGGMLRSGPRCQENSHFLLTSGCSLAPDLSPPPSCFRPHWGRVEGVVGLLCICCYGWR